MTAKATAPKSSKAKAKPKAKPKEEPEDSAEEIGISQAKADGTVETIVIMRKVKTKGRPRLVLTEEGAKHIQRMASWGYTQEEIATALGTNVTTLKTEWNIELFHDALNKGKMQERYELKRVLHRTAMQGNAQVLLFMAKNILGMSDNPQPTEVPVSPLDELAKAIETYREDE